MPSPSSRLFAISFGVVLAATGAVQPVAPALAPASTSASGAAPDNALHPLVIGHSGGTSGGPTVIDLPSLLPYDRPANGPALFAEDFESGAINDKIWLIKAGGHATVSVQSTVVAHGKYALKVTYPAGGRRDYAFIGMTVPAAMRHHLYGRAYMYISGLPVTQSIFLAAGTTGYPPSNHLAIEGEGGRFRPSLEISVPTPDKPVGGAIAYEGTLPVGRWFCLEWEFNDQPDRIVIWVDGKIEVNAPFFDKQITNPAVAKDSDLVGGFTEFDLGYRTFAPAEYVPNDINIYYDDIAIGDKPIGQLTPVPAPANSTAVDQILRNQAVSMVAPASSVALPVTSSVGQ